MNETIQDDWRFYKTEAPFACLACSAGFQANYTHLNFKDDLIYFYLNCSACGEDSYYYVTMKILRRLMVRWFCDPKVDPDNWLMSLWRMFRLGRHYDSCFKSKGDQRRFRELWHDLNKHLKRWGWWYRWRYK